MFDSNLLAFDIETVPDVATGRKLLDMDGCDDKDVVRAMHTLRRQKTGGSEFLALYQMRVVAISVALRGRDGFRVWSLGDKGSDEVELIDRFYRGIEKYTPTLISWNGSGFDLPVLHYRSLLHGVVAAHYWETGDSDREFKWNNYLNRYHWRHIDLMDVLAGFQNRAAAPLDVIATLIGLPGKMGMSGADVWDCFHAGDIQSIRNYCETDVLNTYLVYLQFEFVRGNLSRSRLETEREMVRSVLKDSDEEHLCQFLAHWATPGAS